MKAVAARAVTYGIVATLAVVALRFTPQLPERQPATDLVVQQGTPTPPWRQHLDTLGRGETLFKLFRRGGVSDAEAPLLLRAASVLDPRRVRPGMRVEFRQPQTDSSPNEIVFTLAPDHLLVLHRGDSGWVAAEQHLPWKTDTIVVAGTIHTNLYAAMNESASTLLNDTARTQLAWNLADVYDYKIDMSRDLQDGDTFRVMAERSIGPGGIQKIGTILAAAFTLSGNTAQAVRFKLASGSFGYFDEKGRSLKAMFLRAPLEFRRISSGFGQREHPILGIMRMHKGTDYAAAAGTPVRAIGDGIVTRRGWGNGYGNLLEIRHPNGYVTRYGHLSRYASGVHVGSRVTQGQYVAYVGSTGLATGPHLHFEVLVNGAQRNPRVALKSAGGEPIPAAQMAGFSAISTQYLAALDSPAGNGPVRLAAR